MFYLLFLLFDFVLISVFFLLAVLDMLLIQQPQHPPSTALFRPRSSARRQPTSTIAIPQRPPPSSRSPRTGRQHSGSSRAECERERECERTRALAQPSSIPHLQEALNSLESQMAKLTFIRRKLESRLEQAVQGGKVRSTNLLLVLYMC